jgi:hypothetical protein
MAEGSTIKITSAWKYCIATAPFAFVSGAIARKKYTLGCIDKLKCSETRGLYQLRVEMWRFPRAPARISRKTPRARLRVLVCKLPNSAVKRSSNDCLTFIE